MELKKNKRRRWRPALLAALACAGSGAFAAPPDLVIGQSLNLGHTSDGSARRVDAAVRSYVAKVNAAGGIRGQHVRVVSLDDDGDPKRHAENLRTLVREHGAVAFLNCADDLSCQAAAAVAQELRVPMIGAMSGSSRLGRNDARWLFRVRPDYASEARALAKHLRAIGSTRVAVVTDAPRGELAVAVAKALADQSVDHKVLQLQKQSGTASSMLAAMEQQQFHTAVVVLGLESLEWMVEAKLSESPAWPRVIASTSSANLQAMMTAFKSRVFGFTSVVPNPEIRDRRITREFAEDLAKAGVEFASTFVGLEGYIGAAVAVEALRRAPQRSGDGVAAAMRDLRDLDLGGFVISFGPERDTGSSWIDMGVRSRDGYLLR